jgi:YD repeat-containing protein
MLRRDSRGQLWSADLPFLGTALLRFDDAARLTRFEGAVGAGVQFKRRRDGTIVGISDGSTSISLTRDGAGRLTGWTAGSVGTRIGRDVRGRVVSVEGDRGGWGVQREQNGVPRRLTTPDGAALRVGFDDEGMPTFVERRGGGRTEFVRGAGGRVERVTIAGLGALRLGRDRAGRVVSVGRGVSRWRIDRDRSGLPTAISDPSGGTATLARDASGRIERLILPLDQRWSFVHDASGRLREAVGETGAWALLRRPTGLPNTFLDPTREKAEVDWDTRGRVSRVASPSLGDVSLSYGKAGPSSVGGTRLRWSSSGRLLGWSASGAHTGWAYRLDAGGHVNEVTPQVDSSRGLRRDEIPSTRVQHDAAGRPTAVNDWVVEWGRGGLSSVTRGSRSWTWGRDAAGLIRRLDVPDASVALRREAVGDVREVIVTSFGDEVAWTIRRDSTGRVVKASRLGGATWNIRLDALGRPTGWELLRDGTGLRAAYDRETPRTRIVRIGVPDEPALLTVEDRWDRRGRHVESTIRRAESYGPVPPEPRALEGDRSHGPDPIGDLLQDAFDPIGAVVAASGRDPHLSWAGVSLVDGDGLPVLPSPLGPGTALTASDRLRVADGRGGTVAWVHPLDEELPPDPGEPASSTALARSGDAAPVAEWWGALETAPGDRARVPSGVGADARAWTLPRRSRLARGAGLSAEDPPAGVGAFTPPVPGARRNLPESARQRRIGMVQALVLTGDLPPDAAKHRGFVAGPPDAWQIEIVGAGILADLTRRRANPAEAPWTGEADIVVIAPAGNGLMTARGWALDTAPPFDLRPTVERLPPGTLDVLPGPGAERTRVFSSMPGAGRSGALDRLSDESLGTPGIVASIADDEAVLLALRRFIPVSGPPLSGRLSGLVAAEVWRIETPLGVVVHLDRHGRLVSIDAQGRLHRAFGEACTAAAGRGLATAAAGLLPGLDGMRFLPAPGPLIENRWGLVPTEPRFPLDGRGRPAVPDLVAAD